MNLDRQPQKLRKLIEGKKVLFIASKNRDYIRIAQEIRILQEKSETCDILCFYDKSYLSRMIKLCCSIISCDCKKYDLIYVSFLPQMIIPFFFWKWRKKQ